MKALRNTNAKKLSKILLLEMGFNSTHKIIFSSRLMPKLENADVVPHEIIDERREKVVMHLALNNNSILYAVNAQKLLAISIYNNITNYCNKVVHSFASICAHYFRL